jgi:hypothetical protein
MTSYLPEQITIWFKDEIISVHKSVYKVPRSSRGIRLAGPNEPIKPLYLYIGNGSDISECIRQIKMLEEPVCIIAAGPCDVTDDLIPDEVYLICINSDLASLYNRVRECIHHYRIIESPSDSIHISKTLQQICEDIIECRVTDDNIINARLSEAKFQMGDCFRLFVIIFAETESPNAISWNFIITRLEELFPTCYINMFGNNILIIERNASINNKSFTPSEGLMSLLEQYDCYLGGNCMGFHFSSLSAMYSQALTGIRYGVRLNSNERYHPYESYAMYQMVEFALDACGRLMKTRNPVHLCNIEVCALINHDSANNDNLMEVLYEYLRHNCNISETARALFIHRNTMNNKVHKIEEIIGTRLDCPNLLERLRFSCCVYNYQKNLLGED